MEGSLSFKRPTTNPEQIDFPGSCPLYNPLPEFTVPRPAVTDDLQAEIERLRAENELLKKSGRGKLAMKVSEKGGLSVYGMGRFPVTLYKEQWLKLLEMGDEIKAFIAANNESLKSKE
jgi:hypothetical protein